MARPVHGLLLPPLLAVVCLLLLQVSECSRAPPPPSPADHHDDDELHHQLLLMLLDAEAHTARLPTSTELTGDGRTGAGADNDAAAPASTASAATPTRVVGAVVASSSRPRQTTSDRALLVPRAGMTPAVLLLRSKLARRFLAGAGMGEAASATDTDTDGAAASCRSNNPHVNCGPSASKP